MAVVCTLFILFDAQYENRPAGPWPKYMQIYLGMEPNRVHINFTMNQTEPKCVRSQISTGHICWPFTSLAGHETHAHRAILALLTDFLPGHETPLHNAFIF